MAPFNNDDNMKLAIIFVFLLCECQMETLAQTVQTIDETGQGTERMLKQEVTEKADSTVDEEVESDLCYDSFIPGHDSDCTKYDYLCDDVVYYNLMTWQCPITCGRCAELIEQISPTVPSTEEPTCTDLKGPKGPSDCRKRVALCRHPQYASLMAIQCPKTCRLCKESSQTTEKP